MEVPGKRRRGRPKRRWLDNIRNDYTGLNVGDSYQTSTPHKNRKGCRRRCLTCIAGLHWETLSSRRRVSRFRISPCRGNTPPPCPGRMPSPCPSGPLPCPSVRHPPWCQLSCPDRVASSELRAEWRRSPEAAQSGGITRTAAVTCLASSL